MINDNTKDVTKHGTHDQQSHAGGRGRGGGVNPFTGEPKPRGGGVNPFTGDKISTNRNAKGDFLTVKEDQKLNDLSIDLYNNNQGITPAMRAGKINTPAAQALIQRGQKIVTEAQQVYGGSRGDALNELNRRMGKPSL